MSSVRYVEYNEVYIENNASYLPASCVCSSVSVSNEPAAGLPTPPTSMAEQTGELALSFRKPLCIENVLYVDMTCPASVIYVGLKRG